MSERVKPASFLCRSRSDCRPPLGKKGLEQKCKTILSLLRDTHPQHFSYAAGNILYLPILLKFDLREYDFSRLAVWQACLQGVDLSDVNFAYARLEKSTFTDTFGNILFVAFSPDGQFIAAATTTCEVRLWQ